MFARLVVPAVLAMLAPLPILADDVTARPGGPRPAAAVACGLRIISPPEQTMLRRPASREIGDPLAGLDERGRPVPRIALDAAQPCAPRAYPDATELSIRLSPEPAARPRATPKTPRLCVTAEGGAAATGTPTGEQQSVARLDVVADDERSRNTVRLTIHDDESEDDASAAAVSSGAAAGRVPSGCSSAGPAVQEVLPSPACGRGAQRAPGGEGRSATTASSLASERSSVAGLVKTAADSAAPAIDSSSGSSALSPLPHEPVVELRRMRLIRAKADIEATLVVDESVCKIVPVGDREAWLVAKSAGTTRVAFRFADRSRPPFTCLVRVPAAPPAVRPAVR